MSEVVRVTYTLTDRVTAKLMKIAGAAELAEKRLSSLDDRLKTLGKSNGGMDIFEKRLKGISDTSSEQSKVLRTLQSDLRQVGEEANRAGKHENYLARHMNLKNDAAKRQVRITRDLSGALRNLNKSTSTVTETFSRWAGKADDRGWTKLSNTLSGLAESTHKWTKEMDDAIQHDFFKAGLKAGSDFWKLLTGLLGVMPLVGVAAGGLANAVGGIATGAVAAAASLGRLSSALALLPGLYAAAGAAALGAAGIKTLIQFSAKGVDQLKQLQSSVTSAASAVTDAQNAMRSGPFSQAEVDNLAQAQDRLTLAQKAYNDQLKMTPKNAGKLSSALKSVRQKWFETIMGGDRNAKFGNSMIDRIIGLTKVAKSFLGFIGPQIRALMVQIVSAAEWLAKLFNSKDGRAWAKEVLGQASENFALLISIAKDLVPVFMVLVKATQAYTHSVLESIKAWTGDGANIDKLSGRITGWLERGETSLRKWASIIGNVGSGFANIFSEAAGTTDKLENNLVTISEHFKEWTEKRGPAIKSFFKGTYESLKGMGTLVKDIFEAFGIASGAGGSGGNAKKAMDIGVTMRRFFEQVGEGIKSFARFSREAVDQIGPELTKLFTQLGILMGGDGGNKGMGKGLINVIKWFVQLSTTTIKLANELFKAAPILKDVVHWTLEWRIASFLLGVHLSHALVPLGRFIVRIEGVGKATKITNKLLFGLIKGIGGVGSKIGKAFGMGSPAAKGADHMTGQLKLFGDESVKSASKLSKVRAGLAKLVTKIPGVGKAGDAVRRLGSKAAAKIAAGRATSWATPGQNADLFRQAETLVASRVYVTNVSDGDVIPVRIIGGGGNDRKINNTSRGGPVGKLVGALGLAGAGVGVAAGLTGNLPKIGNPFKNWSMPTVHTSPATHNGRATVHANKGNKSSNKMPSWNDYRNFYGQSFNEDVVRRAYAKKMTPKDYMKTAEYKRTSEKMGNSPLNKSLTALNIGLATAITGGAAGMAVGASGAGAAVVGGARGIATAAGGFMPAAGMAAVAPPMKMRDQQIASYTAGAKGAKEGGKRLKKETDATGKSVTNALARWVQRVRNLLSSLGYSGQPASGKAPTSDSSSSGGILGFAKSIFGFADGGLVPGVDKGRDSVPAVLTPGEVVLNKKQQAAIGHDKIHHALKTTGNKSASKFAKGGMATGGNNPFTQIEQMFGLHRSSGDNDAPGVHTSGSYHYRKAPWGGVQGYDYGDAKNSKDVLMKAEAYAVQNASRFAEAFYDPYGSYVKNGSVIKGAIGNHGDHLHLAIAAAGGAMPGASGGAGGAGGSVNIPGVPNMGPSNFAQAVFGVAQATRNAIVTGQAPPAAAAGGSLIKASASAAKQYAQGRLSSYGWGDQFGALDKLWTRESGWRWNADNPGSDAYGIPQSLPGSKMASKGTDWQTNAATQIDWGLDYIKGRYGSPQKALAHSDETNWYGTGGRGVVTRPTMIGVGEKGPEEISIQPLSGANRNKNFNGQQGGGNVIINSNISMGSFIGDEAGIEMFTEKIGTHLVRHLRTARNGTVRQSR